MNIVQYLNPKHERRVAVVDGDRLRTLNEVLTTYELIRRAMETKSTLSKLIDSLIGNSWVDYEEVIANMQLLLPIDHPDPCHFWITGTGLTHLGSADARDKMHQTLDDHETNSHKMLQLGLSGGKPTDSKIGVQPEWFYKGNGTTLVNPGDALRLPSFSDSGSEEVEVCAFHYIGKNGIPFRVGYALGNEFSDHVMEKKNYLYLAHSKIRPSSFGPELLIDELPDDVEGKVSISRDGQNIWEKPFFTGEKKYVSQP